MWSTKSEYLINESDLSNPREFDEDCLSSGVIPENEIWYGFVLFGFHSCFTPLSATLIVLEY